MLYVGVCDDDRLFLRRMEKRVKAYLQKNKIFGDVVKYQDGRFLVFNIEGKQNLDVVLLDVEMPLQQGVETAIKIKEINPYCLIIFLTSHIQYAPEAVKLHAFRYVLKNNLEQELPEALDEAFAHIKENRDQYYKIINYHHMIRVPFSQIEYIQKDSKNALIHTKEGEIIKVRKTLSKMLTELNSEEFRYLDRGCIGNLSHVLRIEKGVARFDDGTNISISRSNLPILKTVLNKYWGENL